MGIDISEQHIITQIDELKEYFQRVAKPISAQRIGMECEGIGVFEETGKAIPYHGERGVLAILTEMSQKFGWQPIREEEFIIALQQGSTRITLEPGGQIELSGSPHPNLHNLAEEFKNYWKQINTISKPMGIAFLGMGMQPVSKLEEIDWVPKGRYRIMSRYLKTKGSLSHYMMKLTATVQAAVDFADELDAMNKLKLAFGLSPLVTAMFANSPLYGSQPNGFITMRSYIWQDTDPDRCGQIQEIFSTPDPGFQHYINYALRVPTLFIQRNHTWIEMDGIPFGDYIKSGYKGYQATLEDWELHLSTIFTDARLKTYIELRSADHPRPDLALSIPAFWKGIMYDTQSRTAAWELIKDWSWEERMKLRWDVCYQGLQARIRNQLLLDLAQEFIQISLEGLKQQRVFNEWEQDERIYLYPLEDFISHYKASPGRILLEKWNGDWNRDITKLIEYSRY